MKELIENFPENLREALLIAEQNPLQKSYPKFANIVICGMGGSGIGGRLVAGWFIDELDIPVNFCQDYTLPKYVNNKSLVIACSYSGNTEETLSAVQQAHEKGACIIGLTSGGKLAEFCSKFHYECFFVPGGKPPRTQLAFSLVLLTHVLAQTGLIKNESLASFAEAAFLLINEEDAIRSEAKELASFSLGKDLII